MQFLATTAASALGGGAAAGGGVSVASILSGAASVAGILATIGAGAQQAEGYRAQAFQSEMEAQNEQAQSIQRGTTMKRELLRVLGENDVAFAAAGLDLGSGIAAGTRRTASARAAQELSIDRETSDARRAMLRAQASGYRRMAKSAKSAALLGAFGQGANALLSFTGRGDA